MAIPKAPVKRTIQEAGAERVSADAVDALAEHIEEYMEDISKKAIIYARYAKRKTVKAEDIALAIDSSTPVPEEEKHDMFDMIKNVFDSASEGKGFEDIVKSFKKMKK